jgi:hypothetical protein
MNPISLVHLHKLLLSSPHSHWSATGPSSKTRPTTTSHTCSGNTHDKAVGTPNRSGRFLRPVRLLLLDLASHRQGKPVRPIWQTGQAGFVQKLPKTPLTPKTPQEPFLLWAKEAIARRDSVAQKLFMTDHRTKPIRPVWKTGQAGFAWTVGKNTARGKNSKFHANDLPIRSTNQSETLGTDGVPRGLPLARNSVPKTH